MRIFWLLVGLAVCSLVSSADAARRWSSRDGGFSLEADFLLTENGVVTLRQLDGQLFKIDISALSQADQARIRQLQAALSPASVAALQQSFKDAQQAIGARDLASAIRSVNQAKRQATVTELQERVKVVERHINNVDQFWNGYRNSVKTLQAGDQLTLKQGVCRIESTLHDRITVSLDGATYEFDTTQLAQLPHEFVVAVARRESDDVATSRDCLQAFLTLDDATRDSSLWSDAKRGDAPKSPQNPPAATAENMLAKLPTEQQQKESLAVIRELFKDQYDDAKTAADKVKLAETLFQQALQTNDDMAAKFVLCSEAAEEVAKLGQMRPVKLIMDHLDTHFQAGDLVIYKADWLTEISKSKFAKTTDVQNSLLSEAVAAIDVAVKNQKYAAADTLVRAANAGASFLKATEIKEALVKQRELIRRYRSRLDMAKRGYETLKENPNDGPANLAVGIYFAFVLGQWEKGRPYLIKSQDDALMGAVEKDGTSPTDAPSQLAVADAWWELSKSPAYKEDAVVIQKRARYWYEHALPTLTGLTKARVEKQLQEAARDSPGIALKPAKSTMLADLTIVKQTGLYLYRSTSAIPGARANSSNDPIKTVILGGKKFEKGIWAQPDDEDDAGKTVYRLDKKYRSLRGVVGFDESVRRTTSTSPAVHFRVEDDRGKVLWSAKQAIVAGQTITFSTGVSESNAIVLITAANGRYATACWAEMTLVDK